MDHSILTRVPPQCKTMVGTKCNESLPLLPLANILSNPWSPVKEQIKSMQSMPKWMIDREVLGKHLCHRAFAGVLVHWHVGCQCKGWKRNSKMHEWAQVFHSTPQRKELMSVATTFCLWWNSKQAERILTKRCIKVLFRRKTHSLEDTQRYPISPILLMQHRR